MSEVSPHGWWGLERPGMLGVLDWASGIIRMNISREEWERYKADNHGPDASPRSKEIAETVSHEYYHAVQISSTGYPAQFALGLWDLMAPSLKPRSHDINDIDIPRSRLAAVRDYLTQMDSPGRDSLTPRNVIEAAAYHFQVSENWLGANFRLPMAIHRQVPSSYRAAYDLAMGELGEKGFYFMPLLANHALCFDHPGTAFVDFVHNLKATLKRNSNRIYWRTVFEKTSQHYIGDAVEVSQRHGDHPIYSSMTNFLAEHVDGKVLFETPHRALDAQIAEATVPVIIFNRESDKKRAVLAPMRMKGDPVAVQILIILAHRAGVFFSKLQ